MNSFRFSRLSESDYEDIISFTLERWGAEQVVTYLDSLDHCLQLLADRPALGRSADRIRPGLRRFEHNKHVVFFRAESGGILISRILHERMLPALNRIDFDLP